MHKLIFSNCTISQPLCFDSKYIKEINQLDAINVGGQGVTHITGTTLIINGPLLLEGDVNISINIASANPPIYFGNVKDLEIINKTNCSLINKDPLKSIIIDNGNLSLKNENEVKELLNISINQYGSTVTLEPYSNLFNIGEVTMNLGTKIEFFPDNLFLKKIMAPHNNFKINNLKFLSKLAVFIYDKFSSKNYREVKYEEYAGLRAYHKFENKELLKEYITQNFNFKNFVKVDFFIYSNFLELGGICKDLSGSDFATCSTDLLYEIGLNT